MYRTTHTFGAPAWSHCTLGGGIAVNLWFGHRILGIRITNLQQVPVISIVDDDASVREATKSLVRSLGYNAVTFESAEEFLDSTHVTGTSCLITDVQMPGLNGVELNDRLIADGHRLPVIFVTAFPDDRLQGRALRAGAIGFLHKPFSEDHLIECLSTALNGCEGEGTAQ